MKTNIKPKIVLIVTMFFLGGFLAKSASAETIYFDPQTTNVAKGAPFSLVLKIDSGVNVFGVNFNLNFDPSLFKFVNATEGSFLKSGCNTSMLVGPSPSNPGTIIFGTSRLGSSCGGISGSGTIATLNFVSLTSEGSNTPNFSRNSICKAGAECSPTVIIGSWTQPKINIKSAITANMLTASLFGATAPNPSSNTQSLPSTPSVPPQTIANTPEPLVANLPPTAIAYQAITASLWLGSKNEQVKTLQQILATDKTIYPEGVVSGYYGNLTVAAVQKFQCKYLNICSGSATTNGYGNVGPKTMAKINELYGGGSGTAIVSSPATSPSGSKYKFANNLTVGSRNEDVRNLQNILISEGLLKIPTATNYFGNLTKQAVIEFQLKYNLSPAVGYFGPLTRAKINEIFSTK